MIGISDGTPASRLCIRGLFLRPDRLTSALRRIQHSNLTGHLLGGQLASYGSRPSSRTEPTAHATRARPQTSRVAGAKDCLASSGNRKTEQATSLYRGRQSQIARGSTQQYPRSGLLHVPAGQAAQVTLLNPLLQLGAKIC